MQPQGVRGSSLVVLPSPLSSSQAVEQSSASLFSSPVESSSEKSSSLALFQSTSTPRRSCLSAFFKVSKWPALNILKSRVQERWPYISPSLAAPEMQLPAPSRRLEVSLTTAVGQQLVVGHPIDTTEGAAVEVLSVDRDKPLPLLPDGISEALPGISFSVGAADLKIDNR